MIVGNCLTLEMTEEVITGQTRVLAKIVKLENEMSVEDFEHLRYILGNLDSLMLVQGFVYI